MNIPDTVKRIDLPLNVSFSEAQIEGLLTSNYLVEQYMIRYFDNENKSHLAHGITELMANRHQAVIIERIHEYNLAMSVATAEVADYFEWDKPRTVFLFISPPLSNSFGIHTDVEHVYIYCVDGTKTLRVEVDGTFEDFALAPGEGLFIPKGTRHEATNYDYAVSLSFGLERYLEERIEEDE